MVSLIAALLSATVPFAAYSQEAQPDQFGYSREQIIEANYSGPVYLDSYWTSGSSSNLTGAEVQVAPGNGDSTLAVVLINRGPSDIAGITGHLSLPQGFKATGKAAGVPATATFNQIAGVGNTFTLFFDVEVLDSATVGEYSVRLQVYYSRFFETGAPRNVEMIVPFRITGKAILAVNSGPSADSENSSRIAAGKIEDYSFRVANRGTAPITSVVVTMKSPSESLKILGDSKWTIQRIDEDSQADLTTKVFTATSLIGNPASFDVIIEYSSNGKSSTEAFTLGTYIAGEIGVRVYDLAINYIGGTPNLIGSLLNEGNTVALFTTIELVGADGLASSLPPQQYIGDLNQNSPLPFSIPVDVDSRADAGAYPVSLQITYKDNLRELHTFDIDSEVEFAPKQPADESGQNAGISAGVPVGIGAAAAAAIAAIALTRRRKRTALRRTIHAGKQDDDIESMLDSHNKRSDH